MDEVIVASRWRTLHSKSSSKGFRSYLLWKELQSLILKLYFAEMCKKKQELVLELTVFLF